MIDDRLSHALGLTVLFLVVLGLAADPVSAQPGPRGRDHHGALHAYRAALGRVGLGAEQRDRIRAIAEDGRERDLALRAQHLADRARLRALLAAEPPDPAAIGTTLLAVESGRDRLRSSRRAAHEATLAVLTHDQRIAFESALDTLRAVARPRDRRQR